MQKVSVEKLQTETQMTLLTFDSVYYFPLMVLLLAFSGSNYFPLMVLLLAFSGVYHLLLMFFNTYF